MTVLAQVVIRASRYRTGEYPDAVPMAAQVRHGVSALQLVAAAADGRVPGRHAQHLHGGAFSGSTAGGGAGRARACPSRARR